MVFVLKNIKGFQEQIYDFGDTGVCCIQGDNSAGKSILIESLNDILTLRIKDGKKRESLISDWAEYGTLAIQYKEKLILFKIAKELDQTAVSYRVGKGDAITRTLREGGWEEIISDFGWIVNYKTKVCTQIYTMFGLMPCVNTSPSETYEYIEGNVTDSVGEDFVNNYVNVTYKDLSAKVKESKSNVILLNDRLQVLQPYDYLKYRDFRVKLLEVYDKLKGINPFKLDKITIPPNIKYIDIEPPTLNRIPLPTTMTSIGKLSNMAELINEYNSIINGTCPTCGTTLKEVCVCQSC